MHLSQIIAIGMKPLDGSLEPLVQVVTSLESKELFCAGDVKAPAGLAIRLGGIPLDLSLEAHFTGYEAGELTNGDFLPCP